MPTQRRLSPCLWFDGQAEDAANFYTGIFRNSRIVNVSRYIDAGQEIHGQKPGSVMVAIFEIDGMQFTALNGGPHFKFNEAVSFQDEEGRHRRHEARGGGHGLTTPRTQSR